MKNTSEWQTRDKQPSASGPLYFPLLHSAAEQPLQEISKYIREVLNLPQLGTSYAFDLQGSISYTSDDALAYRVTCFQ